MLDSQQSLWLTTAIRCGYGKDGGRRKTLKVCYRSWCTTLRIAASNPHKLYSFSASNTDNRTGEMRWQAERLAAMETSVAYWHAKRKPRQMSTSSQGSDSSAQSPVPSDTNGSSKGNDEVDVVVDSNDGVSGHIVWAGLEPLEFISLFPDWVRRSDVAQVNTQVSKCFIRCNSIIELRIKPNFTIKWNVRSNYWIKFKQCHTEKQQQ